MLVTVLTFCRRKHLWWVVAALDRMKPGTSRFSFPVNFRRLFESGRGEGVGNRNPSCCSSRLHTLTSKLWTLPLTPQSNTLQILQHIISHRLTERNEMKRLYYVVVWGLQYNFFFESYKRNI